MMLLEYFFADYFGCAARESFLLALGIASFGGIHTDLNAQAVLFRPKQIFDEIDEDSDTNANTGDNGGDDDISTHSESDTNSDSDDDDQRPGACTPPLNSNLSSKSADTPGTASRRMIAIESELENDMKELKDRLDKKNEVVSDLQEEIIQLRLDHRIQHEQNIETKKALRLSQRCIE